MMTDHESAEANIIDKATAETHKVAIPVDVRLSPETQDALERLLLRGWLRLIDVASIKATGGTLTRIFVVTAATPTFSPATTARPWVPWPFSPPGGS